MYLDSLSEVSLGWQLFTRSSSLHSDSYIFTRMISFSLGFLKRKHNLNLFRLCRLHTTSDLDDLYIKIDQFDEMKLFRVEDFKIQGRLEGLIARATHQTPSRWVSGPSRHTFAQGQSAVFCFWLLHTNSDRDDLYIKIDQLDETKTIHVEHSFIRGCLGGVIDQKTLRTSNMTIQV